MKVLLVWQLIPEEVKFYVLPDVTQAQLDMLRAQNNFIGGSVEPSPEQERAHNHVSAAICGPKYADDYLQQGVTVDWLSIWHDKTTEDLLSAGQFDMVFTGGFYL